VGRAPAEGNTESEIVTTQSAGGQIEVAVDDFSSGSGTTDLTSMNEQQMKQMLSEVSITHSQMQEYAL
jgi:hypothetical protein